MEILLAVVFYAIGTLTSPVIEKCKTEKEFVIQNASYTCVKTNELKED